MGKRSETNRRPAVEYDERARVVGAALRAARERAGFTQAAVAERAGWSPATVAQLEAGRYLPSVVRFALACRAIGADPGAVVRDVFARAEQAGVDFKARQDG